MGRMCRSGRGMCCRCRDDDGGVRLGKLTVRNIQMGDKSVSIENFSGTLNIN